MISEPIGFGAPSRVALALSIAVSITALCLPAGAEEVSAEAAAIEGDAADEVSKKESPCQGIRNTRPPPENASQFAAADAKGARFATRASTSCRGIAPHKLQSGYLKLGRHRYSRDEAIQVDGGCDGKEGSVRFLLYQNGTTLAFQNEATGPTFQSALSLQRMLVKIGPATIAAVCPDMTMITADVEIGR